MVDEDSLDHEQLLRIWAAAQGTCRPTRPGSPVQRPVDLGGEASQLAGGVVEVVGRALGDRPERALPPLLLLVADTGLVDPLTHCPQLARQREQRVGVDEWVLLWHGDLVAVVGLPGWHNRSARGRVHPVTENTQNGGSTRSPDPGPGSGERSEATANPVADHTDGVLREPSDATDPSYRQPPEGFGVRRPEEDDLGRIAALYRRAAPRAPDGSTGRGALRTARDLRRTWDARRNDALVVERDDHVVGYLEFDEQLDPWTPRVDTYAEGRVDPSAGGGGIGAFMLGRAIDRAQRAATANPELPVVLRTTLVDPLPETVEWFAARGMEPERHLLQLRIDLTTDLPRPHWPRGTHGVRADEVELAALHEALVGAFSDHHLGATDDLDTWRELVVGRDRVQLWASVAATDEGGTPIGMALGHVGGEGDPGLGVIVELGVVPAWRGRGLATALLRASFQCFAGLGVQRVGLEVDDVTLDGALRLYQRAGMEVVHHTVVLRREVSDGG